MSKKGTSRPAQEVKKVTDINQASHMAMPKEVFNALTQLIGQEIPWGKADSVMTIVKQTTAPVQLVEEAPGPQPLLVDRHQLNAQRAQRLREVQAHGREADHRAGHRLPRQAADQLHELVLRSTRTQIINN